MQTAKLLVSLLALLLVQPAGNAQSPDPATARPGKRLERPLQGTVQQTNLTNSAKADALLDAISGSKGHKRKDNRSFEPVDSFFNGSTDSTKSDGQLDMDKFFNDAKAAAKAPAPAPAASAGSDPPEPQPAKQQTEAAVKPVIVRVTGYSEDMNITPRINYDGITMANTLLRKHKTVILLERTSVKLAMRGQYDLPVNGTLVNFGKLLQQFMLAGGEVVVNKKWADEFTVQQFELMGGVQLLTQDQVADVLVGADKVVDYATPNYPFNMRVIMGQH